jgi:glycoprotein-N-acetylgalactosamine 3-beta-galactosyltransferase
VKVEVPDNSLEMPAIEAASDAVPPPRKEEGKLPVKPLSRNRQDIVSKAQPIDLAFVDVSGGHKEHPHMGGKDKDGNLGYVVDETDLRMNPPAFEFDNLEAACNNHDSHYKMLTERVVVDFEADEAAKKSGKPRPKIFCLVYTIDSGHINIPAIRETWAQKCDGFMVGSNLTDSSINSVNIVHEGPEEYNNIWQKVRSMWSYIYDNYYEKYDWFHIGGDDLYLLVENLRLYLESEEIQVAQNGGIYLPNGDEKEQTPLFLGRRFSYMGDMDEIFNSGGSGYTVNKAALKTMVVKGFPEYFPHAHTFSEDTMTAKIFKKFGVLPYETKDDEGSERYMPFMPGHHLDYRIPDGCKPNPLAKTCKDWYPKYSIDIKFGLEHCSKHSVAFHYVKGNSMKRLHAILYGKCAKATP